MKIKRIYLWRGAFKSLLVTTLFLLTISEVKAVSMTSEVGLTFTEEIVHKEPEPSSEPKPIPKPPLVSGSGLKLPQTNERSYFQLSIIGLIVLFFTGVISGEKTRRRGK